MTAARPPECTLELRTDPIYLRRGAVVDRDARLIVTADGRIVRANYQLGPFSHS